MQNAIAQHQQRREKVTCNPQFHCACKSSRIPRQSSDARNRRAREPTFLRNGTFVCAKRHNVSSCKHSNRIHDVAVPLRSANNDLQNTIKIVTSLLYSSLPYTLLFSTLLYSTYTQLLLYRYLYLYPYSASMQLYSTLLYSTSSLLYHLL